MSAERQETYCHLFSPCKRQPPSFLFQRLRQLQEKCIPFEVTETSQVPEVYHTILPWNYSAFSNIISLKYRGADGSLLHVFSLHNQDDSAQLIRSEGWSSGQGLHVLFLRQPTGWVKKVLSACHSSMITCSGYPSEA
jgi:hypothetical protein